MAASRHEAKSERSRPSRESLHHQATNGFTRRARQAGRFTDVSPQSDLSVNEN